MSKQCKICNAKTISTKTGIRCTGECQAWFHQRCLTGKKPTSEAAIAEWRCAQCKRQSATATASPAEPSTPVSSHSSLGADEPVASMRKSGVFQVPLDYANTLTALQRSVMEGNQRLMESIEFMSGRMEELERQIGVFKEALRAVEELKRERDALRGQVTRLARRVDDLEQHGRELNVEIRGVPPVQGENLGEVVKAIGRAAECQEEAEQAVECRRVRIPAVQGDAAATTARTYSNIVVRFQNKAARDGFLRAARKRRPLTTHSLRLPGVSAAAAGPVYVNEHLTARRKQLLSKTREAARRRGYRFVWVQNGRVLVRKAEREQIIAIADEDDILKL